MLPARNGVGIQPELQKSLQARLEIQQLELIPEPVGSVPQLKRRVLQDSCGFRRPIRWNNSAPVLAGLMWGFRGFFRNGTFCTAGTTFSQCVFERMPTTTLFRSIS